MSSELLTEAGVSYCWPRKETDIPPWGCFEYKYRRWRNGRDFGVERIFIQSPHLVSLLTLLDNWTRKGQYADNPYSFTYEPNIQM
jgi:hypothetical protein